MFLAIGFIWCTREAESTQDGSTRVNTCPSVRVCDVHMLDQEATVHEIICRGFTVYGSTCIHCQL